MGMWSTALERRRRGRGRPRQRGQSLVEFALVFPLFILLLAGMIDFGLGLYSYMTINNATRDAARLGATMCTANPCAARGLRPCGQRRERPRHRRPGHRLHQARQLRGQLRVGHGQAR